MPAHLPSLLKRGAKNGNDPLDYTKTNMLIHLVRLASFDRLSMIMAGLPGFYCSGPVETYRMGEK
jgi:hypothetical protein